MKKFIALAMALVLALGLVACGGAASSTPASTPDSVSTPDSTPAEVTGGVKVGMGIVATGAVKSEASADAKGSVQSNSTVAVVALDENGVIVDLKIDVAQTGTSYDVDGTVQDATEVDVRSKLEKGADYGMTAASGIGKEWFEQAAFFEEYAIGKTVADITGIELVESNGHMVAENEADLYAGCTIDISGFQAALAAAAANATDMGAAAGDTLGLGVVTSVSTGDASADAAGKIQHDTTFVATTTDADGKITSNFVNVSQTKYTVSAEGVAECTTPEVTAKYELGADYGMTGASAIGKEWFEQADAFNAYVLGKTAAEVAGIELVESNGHMVAANEADLYAGCSIDISGFQAALAKACA